MTKTIKSLGAACCCLAVGLVGGLTGLPEAALAAGGSVMERLEAAQTTLETAPIESAHEIPIPTVEARQPGPGGTFRVVARKGEINRFRCSSCHTEEQVESQVRGGARFTHGDINLNHGREDDQPACLECHDPNNRNFLMDKKEEQVDFDHSYQLCGQCHFRQHRDWLGGAHGKRLTYWAGQRVVQNCTGCHDPHDPAFPTKMPETYSLPLD